jgi:hypothetical protein
MSTRRGSAIGRLVMMTNGREFESPRRPNIPANRAVERLLPCASVLRGYGSRLRSTHQHLRSHGMFG